MFNFFKALLQGPQVEISNSEEETVTTGRKIIACSFELWEDYLQREHLYQDQRAYEEPTLVASYFKMPYHNAVQFFEEAIKRVPAIEYSQRYSQSSAYLSHVELFFSDGRKITFNKDIFSPLAHKLLDDEYGFDGDRSPLSKQEEDFYEMKIVDTITETATPGF